MFLGQAGMFLSVQARRSSATRSSTSDLTVDVGPNPAVRLFLLQETNNLQKDRASLNVDRDTGSTAHMHTHTRARTHTHTHARMYAHS